MVTYVPDEWLLTTEPGLSTDSFFFQLSLVIYKFSERNVGWRRAPRSPAASIVARISAALKSRITLR